jgi:diguanylate cyclase (GGDEF)-like protein
MNLKVVDLNSIKDAEQNGDEKTLIIGDNLKPEETLELIIKKNYRHITQKGAVAQDAEIRLADAMITSPFDYISYPACSFLGISEKNEEAEASICLINEFLTSPSDKDRLLRKIAHLGSSITTQEGLIDDICSVADELITNAIYNAPYIAVNDFRSGINRDSKHISVDILKKPRFFLAISEEQVFVGVTDHYGSLNSEKHLERIHSCYVNGVAKMINFSNGGAGIGSFKVFHIASGYYIGVVPGKHTTIACSFAKKLSGLARQDLPKSIHLIIARESKALQTRNLPRYGFFEDFLDGVIVVNSSNHVVYVNNMAATFLKLQSPRRMLNRPINTQILPAGNDNIRFFEDLKSPSDNFFFQETFIKTPFAEDILVAYLGVKRFPGTDDKLIYVRDMSMEVDLQDKYSRDKRRLKKALADIETDSLTGCYNKSGILNKLSSKFRASREAEKEFAVVVFDLDGFKKINDTFGHPAGDAYLVNVAHTIKANLREGDYLGRFGGDEFVAIFESSTRASAASAADKVLRVVNELYVPFGEAQLHCTASIGVCLSDPSITSADQLLKIADDCSYIAKKSGKNAVCMYPDKTIL